MTDIHPAASLVLVRDAGPQLQVLMLQRSTALAFAPGSWVFPGGRIDDEDYPDDRGNIIAAAGNAALRETREEAGLDVAGNDWLFFAHWTTPPNYPRRFATWFFVAALEGDPPIRVDNSEIIDYGWVTPAEALRRCGSGEMDMMPPAFITLTELSHCESVNAVMAMYRERGVVTYNPRFVRVDDGACMLYEGDAGYPDGNLAASGPQHRLWLLRESWKYVRQV